MEGAFDPEHRYRLNSLDLVVPDGTGILWGLNLLNRTRLAERVRGPGLMLKTCSAAAEHGLPIFLFGSIRIIVDKLCASLLRRFPRLEIAGVEPSQFRQISVQEDRRLVDRIASSGAAILFVGLGCPRQEVWVFEHLEALQMPMLAVGAAFAMHAGVTGEAPPVWMQQHTLEWLWNGSTGSGRSPGCGVASSRVSLPDADRATKVGSVSVAGCRSGLADEMAGVWIRQSLARRLWYGPGRAFAAGGHGDRLEAGGRSRAEHAPAGGTVYHRRRITPRRGQSGVTS